MYVCVSVIHIVYAWYHIFAAYDGTRDNILEQMILRVLPVTNILTDLCESKGLLPRTEIKEIKYMIKGEAFIELNYFHSVMKYFQ